MLFQNLVLIAAILMLAVLLAYRPVLSSKETGQSESKALAGALRISGSGHPAVHRSWRLCRPKEDRLWRLRERAAISQIATNETKTQSDAMCEMARNGVSVKHDSADHHRSVEGFTAQPEEESAEIYSGASLCALKALFKKDS